MKHLLSHEQSANLIAKGISADKASERTPDYKDINNTGKPFERRELLPIFTLADVCALLPKEIVTDTEITALGKQKETITQEDIEKVAKEYVLTRQQARHNAKREEDATLRDFDKTIKAWDAFDMEQAYEDGANFALGKQENDADTVIQGWVARDDDGQLLYLYGSMPTRGINMWNGHGTLLTPLNTGLYPDLTWESEPQEVEITIKRKKK